MDKQQFLSFISQKTAQKRSKNYIFEVLNRIKKSIRNHYLDLGIDLRFVHLMNKNNQ